MMFTRCRAVTGAALAAAVVAIATPALGQPAPARPLPSKGDPLRMTAFAVQMQGGRTGTIQIAIERWTTEAERAAIVGLLKETTARESDQQKLVKALQDIKDRTGFLRTPNSMGGDLKYAHENRLPDGTRQVVLATDKPISFFAVTTQSRTREYPFTLIELRFPPDGGKGEGKLLGQSSLSVKDGQLQIEIYGQQPARLTEVTEQQPKGSK